MTIRTSYISIIVLLCALLAVACGPADESAGGDDPVAVADDVSATPERSDPEQDGDPPEETDREPPASEEEESGGQSYAGTVPAPEFPAGLDWLNTDEPLTLADLRGKVVLLDFWTYGCINCIHIIPDLKMLEEKYADELVVIGVHSAKFENESDTDNIRRIIQRYELEHPVVNDNKFQIWSEYGAQAWPTLVLIDPDGNVLGYHSGEGIFEPFDQVIGAMIDEFDVLGRIDRTPLRLKLETESLANSPLLFPGKVEVDSQTGRLFIADSNHNRIVVTDLGGQVLDVIGDGRSRLQDGSFERASFFRPQGLALDSDLLYVADTENHAIRKIDLSARTVETIAGTGQQVFMRLTSGPAASTPLNSPWDVLFHADMLYIAMAGQHQIWVYDPASEEVRRYAGSGREELSDGPLTSAGLNQPSGMATDGEELFIADSEASAIRAADLDIEGELRTIVGTGLFDFGDVDGQGGEVRLQHPLGVVYHENHLYVADTYNSKIKLLDPLARTSETFLGGPESGWRDGLDALFDEPGGLDVSGDKLYIADTNNHVVRVADLDTRQVSTLVLIDNQSLLTRQPPGEEYDGLVVTLDTQSVAPGSGQIELQVSLPDGYKPNDLAPFSMSWTSDSDNIVFDADEANRQIIEPQFPLSFPAEFRTGNGQVTADLTIYYCQEEAQSLCLIERVRVLAQFSVDEGGQESLVVSHTVELPALN